jgi:light-regulated signal transduction histidine kinase (bacteriophytochrome)
LFLSTSKRRIAAEFRVQNQELNEYAHVVSHDLKAPLRNVDALVNFVIEDNKHQLGESCLNSLNLVLFNVEKWIY